MASAGTTETHAREKICTRSTTKTRNNAKPKRENTKGENNTDTQSLGNDIEKRDIIIGKLRRKLRDATNINVALRKEVEDIRAILESYTTKGDTNTEEGTQVIGKRRHRTEMSKTETKNEDSTESCEKPPLASSAEPPDTHLRFEKQDLIKEVINESMDERQYQTYERKRRAPNIIVHGMEERPGERDDETARRFLSAVETNYIPKFAVRLGAKKPGATRPIKLSMNNVNEKRSIMKSLPKLKNSHLRVHVTDDYTLEDRKKISLLNSEAKVKNRGENGSYVWRVTGSPTTTLRLKRTKVTNGRTPTTRTQDDEHRAIRRGLERPVNLKP